MGFTEEKLRNVEDCLREMADEKYREFHRRLIPGVETVFYGVRVPALRKLARQLAKEDWRGFVELTKDSSVYEFNMLCGMVCALAKCDFEEKLEYVEKFIPSINNWARSEDVKNNRERMYQFILPYLESQQEYEVRFAVVILMQYFVTDEYINDVLKIYNGIRHNGYYVKMAVAWGISICYVKYRDITLEYLASCNLDDFTYNKSVQKMIESLRVSREDKEMLRSMKR